MKNPCRCTYMGVRCDAMTTRDTQVCRSCEKNCKRSEGHRLARKAK